MPTENGHSIGRPERKERFMNRINDEKDMLIEEQAATIRLLTDLTEAGSWVINYAPDTMPSAVRSPKMAFRGDRE